MREDRALPPPGGSVRLEKLLVGVEKGTSIVILTNFNVYNERGFNNLQTDFSAKTSSREFFNSHACFQQLPKLSSRLDNETVK
jgi:hypothetical protein